MSDREFGRIVFLFPGQGVLPETLPTESERVTRWLDLAEEQGVDVRQLLESGNRNQLVSTNNAQPVILIDSLARELMLREAGFRPSCVAGHSLGEYAALGSAKVLDTEEIISIVIERGRLMSEHGLDGGMLAVLRLTLDQVESICARVKDIVIANHNADRQIVISGTRQGLSDAADLVKHTGGKTVELDVSGAFHSPLMDSAAEILKARIGEFSFQDPVVGVISGVSGEVETSGAHLKALMKKQITSRVNWVDVVKRMEDANIETAIEVGPGSVLSGLGRRITDRIQFCTCEEAIGGEI